MKKTFTLLAILPLATAAFGQAVTINSSDMPAPTGPQHLRNFTTATAPNPARGTSATWDYSAYAGTPDSNSYYPETDTFFTNAGIDVYRNEFKSLLPGLGYYVYNEYDFNTANVKESGLDVPWQGYDISSMTMGSGDSLVIPAQRALLTQPKEVIRFPFTAATTWTSVSRKTVTLEFTVAAFSLSHTPVQHVFNVHRSDSIIGWGKMRIYATSGPSAQYDVLMDKIAQYSVDSFYMSGSPAPSTLLNPFGMYQGQKTDSTFRYNFYRKGSFGYLLSFSYGRDASYTSASAGKFMSSDNILPSAVNDVDGSYSVVLYPNPVRNGILNVMVVGADLGNGSYTITDVTGRVVKTGGLSATQSNLRFDLDESFTNGNYIISIADGKNVKIATEQFSVVK